jgi:hypothetical protein
MESSMQLRTKTPFAGIEGRRGKASMVAAIASPLCACAQIPDLGAPAADCWRAYGDVQLEGTQRAVDVGQQVPAGMRLIRIVPVTLIHVDATFKEGQSREAVRLTSDFYGSGRGLRRPCRRQPEQLAEHPLRVGLSMKATVELDAGKYE